jgi:hypothetical protein
VTWEETDDALTHSPHVSSLAAASCVLNILLHGFPGQGSPLEQVQARPLLGTPVFPGSRVQNGPEQLNRSEQESWDHGQVMQAITQWLQTDPDRVLMLHDAEALVLVALKKRGMA